MSCTNKDSMPPLTVSHGGSPENAELKQRSASQPMSRVTALRQGRFPCMGGTVPSAVYPPICIYMVSIYIVSAN